jgi:hypothetical protein
MASAAGRGAQVILDGDAQAAARGALSRDLRCNAAAKRALELQGVVPDGYQPDGSTITGTPADDLDVTSVVRPQVIANRGILSHSTVTGFTTFEGRQTVRNGGYPATDVQLALTGFIVGSAAEGELALPSAITQSASVEKLTPSNKAWVATFRGAMSQSFSAALGSVVLSDPIGVDLDAGESFKVQVGAIVATIADTHSIANLTGNTGGDDGWRSTTNTTVQIGTAGTWASTGRTSTANSMAPAAIIGRPTQNYPSVAFVGDSIMQSRDDLTSADAYGHRGFGPRGMVGAGPGGNIMPFINMARAGERAVTFATLNCVRRLTLLQYVSHVIGNEGTNDVQQGRTFAQVSADLTATWKSLKARGLSVWWTTIMPRTTSTDNWATIVNQTVVAGFEVGGVRDQVNAWMRSQVGILLDGLIDVAATIEDTANHGKWIVNGTANYATSDGVHPSTVGHTLAAVPVLAAARTFTLPRSWLSAVRI